MLWGGSSVFPRAMEYIGCTVLQVGSAAPFNYKLEYIRTLCVNTLIALPSTILKFAQQIEENKINLKIRKIITGGEHLFDEAKLYLNKILGVEEFLSTGYASNESGTMAYQCGKNSNGYFHLHESAQHVEIFHDEKNEILADNSEGRIVVTNLLRTTQPVIRYEQGDRIQFINENCPCGRTTKLIKLLGRSDSQFRVAGADIFLDEITKCISFFPDLSFNFQIKISKTDKNKDFFSLEVEKNNSKKINNKDIEKKLFELIIKNTEFNNMDDLKKSNIEIPTIIICEPDHIPRNIITGKIRNIIDLRIK